MDLNIKSSEYLAPEIKVVGLKARGVLCQSVTSSISISDPLSGNTEEDW